MRLELFYNPFLLLERIGQEAASRRRLRRLRGTPASLLEIGHIDSLELLELLRKEPPQIIYDVGANVGTWTLLAKAIFPHAEIHAFEPLAIHIARFKHETRSLNNVHLHPVALGGKKEKLAMKVTNFSDSSSLLEPNSFKDSSMAKTGEQTVTVENLDDFASANQLPPPDLIKLDVQGYELEILCGAPQSLKEAKYIISEVSFVEYYSKQCLFEDVVAYMVKQGFRISALACGTKLGCQIGQTDVLFMRSKQ